MASIPSLILGSASLSRASVLRAACIPFSQASSDIDEKDTSLRFVDVSSSIPALYQVPIRIARAKAAALLTGLRERAAARTLLICADQIVADDDDVIREKPASREEALAMLTAYSGRTARCISAVHVVNVATGQAASGVEVSAVHYDASLADAVRSDAGAAALRPAPPRPHASLPFTHPASCRMLLSHDLRAFEDVTQLPSAVLPPPIAAPDALADPMHCAGGVCMEHPFSSAFITRIDGTWDSVLGLPWTLTQR